MSAEQPTKIGKYYGLEVAGRGNTATVYHGYDPFADQDVAIKLSHQTLDEGIGRLARKLFYNEAQTAGALVHPHIVRLLDAGEESGLPYLVMEYVGGGRTLQSHCRSGSLLEPARAAEITYHCARALDYSHRNGVVHRDVKPTNVLLEHGDFAKLTDFGIAQCASAETTQIAGMLGSPRYMSPEQVLQEPITAATDIYSLGIVMHELLTGSTPFTAESLPALMYSIVNQEPCLGGTRERLCSGALDIVRRALSKEPEERFANASQFADALSDVFGLSPSSDEGIDNEQKRRSIAALEFFSEFDAADIDELLAEATWRRYDRGETIVLEGSLDLAFYVIASGRVSVNKTGTQMFTLGGGECFGEMGYLSKSRRTATIVALEPVLLLSLDSRAVRATSKACQIRFNEAFIRTLVARLSHTSELLLEQRQAG